MPSKMTSNTKQRLLKVLRIKRSHTAAATVFAIPELVEMILLNLPFKQLFVIRRVSIFFQNLIDHSEQVQCAMYLRYRSALSKNQEDVSIPPQDVLSPLVYETLKRMFQYEEFWCATNVGTCESSVVELYSQKSTVPKPRRLSWLRKPEAPKVVPLDKSGTWTETRMTSEPYQLQLSIGLRAGFHFDIEFPAGQGTLLDLTDSVDYLWQYPEDCVLGAQKWVWRNGELESVML